jgi:hypothetical protein
VNRFDERLTRELDEIADRATTSRSRAANYTDEYDKEVIVMLAPSDTNTRRPRWIVPAALATAAAGVLAVVGAVVFRDTRDDSVDDSAVGTEMPSPAVVDGNWSTELTADQQAAIAVVIAHNDAQNARDGETMLATLTADAVWTAVFDGKAQDPLTAEDYVAVIMGYGPAPTTFTGDPIVSEDLWVAVPARRDKAFTPPDRDGLMVYEVRQVDGQMKIAAIYWMS